jgi:DNA-directed RNA polymerase specialized sigma24 family protein
VITFYFYEGLTSREKGRALNLIEGRISQILRRTLAKLRETLTEGTVLGENIGARSTRRRLEALTPLC